MEPRRSGRWRRLRGLVPTAVVGGLVFAIFAALRLQEAVLGDAEAGSPLASLPTPDLLINWKKVAGNLIREVTKMMDEDMAVLDAEAALSKGLKRMEGGSGGPRGGDRTAAAKMIREAPVFSEVAARASLYESVNETLAPAGFKLCWRKDDAEMYIRSLPGATSFEYRLVAGIDAPLSHCLAPLHERDLMTQYQPIFVEPHKEIGPGHRHHAVVRTLSRVWSVYVETVFELVRVTNKDFGFLAEVAKSEFPTGKLKIPDKNWWSRRVDVDTRNLWLPRGGGKNGTVLVSLARVQVGVPIPENMLTFILNGFAEGILDNARRGAALATTPGSPWRERLQRDADGLYAELNAAEAAASKRRAISATDLPGPEVFDRPWRLT